MISAGWIWIERGTDLLWPASLELVFAATLLLLIAAVMHLGLRRAAASLRHRVWALTMGGLLLVPLLCPILPKLPLPLSIPLAGNRPVAEAGKGTVPFLLAQKSGQSPLPSREEPSSDSVAFRSAKAANDPAPLSRSRSTLPQRGRRLPADPRPGCGAHGETVDRERPFAARQNPLCVGSRLGTWQRALSAGDGPMAMAGATLGEERWSA